MSHQQPKQLTHYELLQVVIYVQGEWHSRNMWHSFHRAICTFHSYRTTRQTPISEWCTPRRRH